MYYGTLLFVHLTGVALWIGSVLMTVFLLLSLKNKISSQDVSGVVTRVVKTLNRITHPAAFLVLLSGILMLVSDRWGMENHDSFPFYITFMEQAGSLLILAFIIIITILGKKLTKKLAAGNVSAAQSSIQTYVWTSLLLIIGVLAIVYIVSNQLGI